MTAVLAAAAFGAFLVAGWRIVTGRRGASLWRAVAAAYGFNALSAWSTGREGTYIVAGAIWVSIGLGLLRLVRWGYDAIRMRVAARNSPRGRA